MLTQEENETLCRVGPETPMGNLLRQYWMPALRSARLQADGAPARVRLMGENFVAFRAGDGRVGFFDEGCPHRCTSLALARNEDSALTCIFHGWKIDVSGKVVDVPSEPPERRAEFAAKVRVRHYPVREAGGMVWVYLGKGEQPPAFPNFEFNNLPPGHVMPTVGILHFNWFQGLEVVLDSAHVGILHQTWASTFASADVRLATNQTGPRFEFEPRPYGFREGALRELADGSCFARIREVVLPFFSFIPFAREIPCVAVASVPVDDEWSLHWIITYDVDRPIAPDYFRRNFAGSSGDPDNFTSNLGEAGNLWHQDRKAMKEGHWTGISCLAFEDFVVQEAMGAISDRTREYLGSSDTIIIRTRRLMLEAARAYARGERPFGLGDEVDLGRIRAASLVIEDSRRWRQVDPMALRPASAERDQVS